MSIASEKDKIQSLVNTLYPEASTSAPAAASGATTGDKYVCDEVSLVSKLVFTDMTQY